MPKTDVLQTTFSSRPVLLDSTQVEVANAYLARVSDAQASGDLPAAGDLAASGDFWTREGNAHPYRPYIVQNGILHIPVQGVLLHKFPYAFGGWATGYAYIEQALIRGLADPDVKGIALVVDSPGGEVAGCFECGDAIFAARQEKPIRAYAEDHAYSAAYALSSSASELIVTRSGGTGSVGVLTYHVDLSSAYEKMGVKITLIYAGDHKVDGNPYEALPDSVKARIQERIEKIYGVFTTTVARNRGMDESKVRGTKALTYDSTESVAVGFADRIGALADDHASWVTELDDAGEQEDDQAMTTFTQEQMDAAVATAVSAEKAKTDAAHAAGVTAERSRVAAIRALPEAAKRSKATEAMISEGMTAETAKRLLAALPEEAETTAAAPQTEGTTLKTGNALDAAMDATGGGAGVGEGGAAPKGDKLEGFFSSIGHAPVAPARN